MSEVKVSNQKVMEKRRGMMLVLSSPSGAGKTTLARNLLTHVNNLELSISVTTRKRRASEIDGVHYHFVDQKRFNKMRDDGELLEWAMVHEYGYGTLREPVEEALSQGKDVLFDIDIQGTKQLNDAVGDDVVSVFILPPSIAEMKFRLRRRAEDTEEVIQRRLKTAVSELKHWVDYDYLIVNDDLEIAFERLNAILMAERQRRSRLQSMNEFIEGMVGDLKVDIKK